MLHDFVDAFDIPLDSTRSSGGGKLCFTGYSHERRTGVALYGALLTEGNRENICSTQHVDFHIGPNPVIVRLNETDTTVPGKAGTGPLESRTRRFAFFHRSRREDR